MIGTRTTAGGCYAKGIALSQLSRRQAFARGVVTVAFIVASLAAAAQTAPSTDALSCANLALAERVIADANPTANLRVDSPTLSAADRATCWVDLAALPASDASQPTWVDVRAAADARAARIPGALAIPLAEIGTKTFLQNMPVVLIGSGRDDADLVRACGELKRAGFRQVRLLRGGIRAWVNAQRPVLADGGVAQTFDLIGPSEFHRQAAGAPWLVLGIDVGQADGLPATVASFEQITGVDESGRTLDAIRRHQATMAQMSSAERPNAIVVVTRDDASAMRLRDEVRHAGLADVLILQGGMIGYQAFLAQQHSIAAAAGKPLVRSCGSS